MKTYDVLVIFDNGGYNKMTIAVNSIEEAKLVAARRYGFVERSQIWKIVVEELTCSSTSNFEGA